MIIILLLTLTLIAPTLFLSTDAKQYPTVILHGIASNTEQLKPLETYLRNDLDIETYNIEIGNGKIDSITMNMNKQCSEFANTIRDLNISTSKINLIGISQGGLTTRCYVERYSGTDDYPVVNVLMTMGTPHAGYYNTASSLKKMEYWKDPFNYQQYLVDNDYLADINNERNHSDFITYRKRVAGLAKFILVWSINDAVIKPIDSSRFEFYDIEKAVSINQLIIQPLNESNTYKKNELGLHSLHNENNLLFWQTNCEHDKFKTLECFKPILTEFIQFF